MRLRIVRALAALAFAIALAGLTGPTPSKAAGNEFRINTFTANSQSFPSATRLADGSTIVVWTSYLQDGAESGIYAQRLRANGARQGGEFRVNTVTAFDQAIPDVAGLTGGGFVVVWDSSAPGGVTYDVYGQRYGANGAKAGAEFRVNTFTAGSQSKSRVAALSDGGFMVVWQSDRNDGTVANVYGQRYKSNGAKAGTEIRVNRKTAGNQNGPAIAGLVGGGYVVVWTSDSQDGAGYGAAVIGQRFLANGGRAGGEFRANTPRIGEQYQPRIAALTGGGFVVVWTDDTNSNSSPISMYGQVYSAAGAKVGTTQFQVNSTFAAIKDSPDVAALSTGGFVVVWQALNASGDEWHGIYGRRFSSAGVGIGNDFHANQTTTDYQTLPVVTELANGTFFVIWESYLQDGSESGVYARRF